MIIMDNLHTWWYNSRYHTEKFLWTISVGSFKPARAWCAPIFILQMCSSGDQLRYTVAHMYKRVITLLVVVVVVVLFQIAYYCHFHYIGLQYITYYMQFVVYTQDQACTNPAINRTTLGVVDTTDSIPGFKVIISEENTPSHPKHSYMKEKQHKHYKIIRISH